ncbi:MAG: ATP-dependent RecD-like DNA helicase [Lachnospiraceae bacterium]|nr:ATP-dependent RecD-like DNA helicase [Lachnospiraceae bacterium]
MEEKTLKGYVEKIVFRNEENGYTVLHLSDARNEWTLVGTFGDVHPGEHMTATGELTNHPVYGEQLNVKTAEIRPPESTEAIERYLGSGAIKGIGVAMAARIVRHFKADTLRVVEEEPERLAEVKGISEKKAREIGQQMEEQKEQRKAMIFLAGYGISNALAIKIYRRYGEDVYDIIRTNPYRLADDIRGVGFKIADDIARKAGILADSDFRIKSGILYTLEQASANGHTCLPMDILTKNVVHLLDIPFPEEERPLDRYLMDLVIDRKVTIKKEESAELQEMVYLSSYYFMELNAARMLLDLNTLTASGRDSQIDREIRRIEAQVGVTLDDLQRQAVKMAAENGVCIVTGGPGTGKTTIINIIIRYFEAQELDILLAAPTGRAAKRMTEATGHEAKTIHRLLELKTLADDSFDGAAFEKNENNPLEADVIIIDEMSMVDIFLIQSLLKAIAVGTRVIFVGDVDQLPSVGPGNVLKDLIESGKFPVAALKKIYRQDDGSDIVVNAHKINDGIPIDLSKRSKDFLFVHRDDANRIISAMITLLKEKIPKYVDADPLEVQVLTPMRRGALGVEGLNKVLQEYLNPPAFSKEEHEVGGVLFRVGDKVMQTKNDYQMRWEVRDGAGRLREEGVGIFNGDMGIITRMNPGEELMEVRFDEDRYVLYSFKDADELELAYAVTIHKSQGSEYPAVILPMLSGPRMLMNRNLLYTAVTRAKKCVCMVGVEATFHEMAKNVSEVRRYSGLRLRLDEIAAADGAELG